MMFFNPSLRTRNSFEAGIFQLGGHAHFLEPSSTRLPTLEGEDLGYASERIVDMARVLSRMGDALSVRILGDVVGWEYDKALPDHQGICARFPCAGHQHGRQYLPSLPGYG